MQHRPHIEALDLETLTAERFAEEDANVRAFRQHAVCAAYLGDWLAFFTAAAECARAMNRREALLDAAPVCTTVHSQRMPYIDGPAEAAAAVQPVAIPALA